MSDNANWGKNDVSKAVKGFISRGRVDINKLKGMGEFGEIVNGTKEMPKARNDMQNSKDEGR